MSGNDWEVFRKKGMHFIHKNISSLLPKIDKVRYIANIINAFIIGISETKLDETILSSELEINSYDLAKHDRSRRGGDIICYITDLQQHRKYFCCHLFA